MKTVIDDLINEIYEMKHNNEIETEKMIEDYVIVVIDLMLNQGLIHDIDTEIIKNIIKNQMMMIFYALQQI